MTIDQLMRLDVWNYDTVDDLVDALAELTGDTVSIIRTSRDGWSCKVTGYHGACRTFADRSLPEVVKKVIRFYEVDPAEISRAVLMEV